MIFRFLILAPVLAGITGCGPSYSPDTYASNAAQQANKVEQGIVVGMRAVAVSAAGTVGTVAGAAAGGIAGSQVGVGPVSAFSALGGSLVGGFGGSAVEHVTADTTAFEYIVRKPNGDLVSVTQKDKTPLVLGQKVLVIAGVQARVVPDYTVPPLASSTKPGDAAKGDATSPASRPADPKPADAQPAAPTPPSGEVSPADPKQNAPTSADGKQTTALSADTKSPVGQPGDPKPATARSESIPAASARPGGSATP